MSGLFVQTDPSRRRYSVAAFVAIIAGVVSSFVKWGAEHPFPPRSPLDLFTAACKDPSQALEVCSRAFLNPPHVFLRDYIGCIRTVLLYRRRTFPEN